MDCRATDDVAGGASVVAAAAEAAVEEEAKKHPILLSLVVAIVKPAADCQSRFGWHCFQRCLRVSPLPPEEAGRPPRRAILQAVVVAAVAGARHTTMTAAAQNRMVRPVVVDVDVVRLWRCPTNGRVWNSSGQQKLTAVKWQRRYIRLRFHQSKQIEMQLVSCE